MCPSPLVLVAGAVPLCSFRLAKATLTLIPLFGIHEVVFIFATDEQTTGILRYVKVFFTLFLNSFQVRWERDTFLLSLLCPGHRAARIKGSLFQLTPTMVPGPVAGLGEGDTSSPTPSPVTGCPTVPPVLSKAVLAGEPRPRKRPEMAWGDSARPSPRDGDGSGVAVGPHSPALPPGLPGGRALLLRQ